MAIDPQKQMLEEEIKKSVQSGTPIAPELMEYAKSIFPSLQDQNLPADYNQLAQQEAIDQPQAASVPPEYDQLAQQEANDQNPLPEDYNQLAQDEADQQDNFSEPMRLEKTPQEMEAFKNKMQQAYPFDNAPSEAPVEEQPIPEDVQQPQQDSLTPELMDYAYNIFPSLEQIVPKAKKVPSIPMRPEEEQPEPVAKEAPTAAIAPKKQVVEKMAAMPSVEPEVKEQQLKQELPEEKETSIDEMIKKYREAEDKADLFKSMAKFRDAVMGAGLGRVPTNTDYSMYDEMKAKAKRPIEDVLLKNQLNDTKAKSDPNSEISKLMRQTLGSLGIDMSKFSNVSYTQLEKIYPSLSNTIATKIAADARKQQTAMTEQLRAEARAEGKSLKEQQMQDRRLSELTKRTDNVLKSEEYKLYNNIGTTNALIDEAIQMWEDGDDSYKQTTQAAFMGFAKAAQQDSSVVRESDMRVLAGGVNYGSLGGMLQKIIAKGKGADYSPEELEGFKKAVEIIRDVKRRDLQSRFTPILSRASDADISPDYLVSPDTLSDIYSAKKEQPTVDPLQQQLKDIEAKLNANQSRIESLRKKKAQ